MKFTDYLQLLANKDGSDLYLTTGAPPVAKVQGKLIPLEKEKLSSDRIKEIAYQLMDDEQQTKFKQIPEMNLAISEAGIGRFRVNIFKQRNSLAMVIRNIKVDIPSPESLGLPECLKKIMLEKRGLMLFVGGTGSGKSTSLAALTNHRNSNSSGHIITIEDPIEFLHPHKRCLVNQREIGIDTLSYEDALENTLRQAPDVIFIGEIRTQETIEYAITFAETGHLCLSTLHANSVNQALDRIINSFPKERRNQLLLDLSLNLRAIVSQRLILAVDGKQIAVYEILIGTQLVRDLIHKGNIHEITDIMEKSEHAGMQTFDMHLLKLYQQGSISLDEALMNSISPTNFKLKISLSNDSSAPEKVQSSGSGALSLIDKIEEEPDEEEGADENKNEGIDRTV